MDDCLEHLRESVYISKQCVVLAWVDKKILNFDNKCLASVGVIRDGWLSSESSESLWHGGSLLSMIACTISSFVNVGATIVSLSVLEYSRN